HDTQETALEKASSEAIEHLICDKLKIGSVGFAISGESSAEIHAQHEALERYFFNEHIRLNISFQLVQNPDSPLYNSALRLSEEFKILNTDAHVTFYKMSTPEQFLGVVCSITLKSKLPEFLGLSLGTNPEHVSRHALCEALANYARKKDSPETFDVDVEKDKNLWACNKKTLQSVSHLFTQANQNNQVILLPEIFTHKLDISMIHSLSGCPIQPIQCVLAKKDHL
ncbi:MAG: hypothetical protein KDD38_11580, partial [Bdellovibrionales bacterium]|nr:hypothetical protein [Bdellovibrionales bacterium]